MKLIFVVASSVALFASACPTMPGQTCRTHGDCSSLKDGYCSRAEVCTRECDESRPCPSGSACVAEGRRRVCLDICTSTGDCPPLFVCREHEEIATCRLERPFTVPAK
jgi:hypothetical protein